MSPIIMSSFQTVYLTFNLLPFIAQDLCLNRFLIPFCLLKSQLIWSFSFSDLSSTAMHFSFVLSTY